MRKIKLIYILILLLFKIFVNTSLVAKSKSYRDAAPKILLRLLCATYFECLK
jgi:hypothetical protein